MAKEKNITSFRIKDNFYSKVAFKIIQKVAMESVTNMTRIKTSF